MRIGVYIVFLLFSLLLPECSTTGEPGNLTEVHSADDQVMNGAGKFSGMDEPKGIDSTLVARGRRIYERKCASCHKLNKETLVGPGWEGSTRFYRASWIMNFITNTDQMLNENAQAKELIGIYQVRMPDQGLSDDDARSVLEFMRYIDQH